MSRGAGRIVAKRDAGKKLSFIDIVQEGHRVQVLSMLDGYEGDPADSRPAADQFRAMTRLLHRGDYIGEAPEARARACAHAQACC